MKKIIIAGTGLLLLISCQSQKKSNSLYRGEDMSKKIEITRDRENKIPNINLTSITERWSLYAGSDVDNINFSEPILVGTEGDVDLRLSAINSYQIFALETSKGQVLFAEKLLPLEGGHNFRDMGGIKNKEGRFVKWGQIFRADELGNLSDNDLEYLSTIPLKSIIDFRSDSEVEQSPDKAPKSVVNQYRLPIVPGNLPVVNHEDFLKDYMKSGTGFDAKEFMKSINKQFVTDSTAISQYKKFFEILQQKESTPLIFHCTAGKDRTGMGAALFLYSLGVDEEVIMENYLESNIFLEAKYQAIGQNNDVLKSMFMVEREYILTGIDAIKAQHGSVEQYLTKVLNVDLDLMKEMYLYPL